MSVPTLGSGLTNSLDRDLIKIMKNTDALLDCCGDQQPLHGCSCLAVGGCCRCLHKRGEAAGRAAWPWANRAKGLSRVRALAALPVHTPSVPASWHGSTRCVPRRRRSAMYWTMRSLALMSLLLPHCVAAGAMAPPLVPVAGYSLRAMILLAEHV